MGVDIFFYVQKKKVGADKWENVTMFKGNGEEVALYRRGYDAWDYIKTEFARDMTEDEIKEDKAMYKDEDPEEHFEKNRFWTELRDELDNFLTFTDEEFNHPDRIRLVALCSY